MNSNPTDTPDTFADLRERFDEGCVLHALSKAREIDYETPPAVFFLDEETGRVYRVLEATRGSPDSGWFVLALGGQNVDDGYERQLRVHDSDTRRVLHESDLESNDYDEPTPTDSIQATTDVDVEGTSEYRLDCRASYPHTEDGELDFQTMAVDLGIAEVAPYSKVFITDGTGHVRRIVSCDTDRGLVRLHDEYNGQEYEVELADLWSDWRYDDLQFRKRAFLDYDDFVIDDECRPAFETLLDAAKAHAAAQDGGDEALDETIRLFTNLHELPWMIR